MLTRRIQALAALALLDLTILAMERKLQRALAAQPATPGLDLTDIHAHCCDACGFLWKHPTPINTASAVYAGAHLCPQCKTGPYRVRLLEHEFSPQSWAEMPYIEPVLTERPNEN